MKGMILLVFFCFSLLHGVRVHVSELEDRGLTMPFFPDVAGYVLLSEPVFSELNYSNSERNLPELFPGFPVSYTNANTHNGAVYFNMDDDPEMEVLFGVGTQIVALKTDGTPVPGWPVSLSYYIWGSPAIGDITGDGNMEIVATSRQHTHGNAGALYAFNQDGTLVSGFPVTQSGGGTMNACLADITGDGVFEILVNVRNHPEGWVYVYDGTGQVVPGWPQALDTFPGAGISSGDINGNGFNEVIALSYQSLFVFDNLGNLLEGFPLSFPGVTFSYSSPVLVDFDGDGNREIVFGGCTDSGGQVFVVNHDGTMRPGWPQNTGNWIFATVSIADINGSGELDVIVGDQVGSAEPANFIYAWDKDGSTITGFPAGPTNAIYTQIGIADITGDGNVNLVIDSNLFGYGYDCYNHDGTHNEDWPLPCGTDWSSVTMNSTPVFGDFTGDGNIDMAGAATGFTTWLVELYLWNTGVPFNEELAYMIIDGCNIQHNGVFSQEMPVTPVILTASTGNGYVELTWNEPACLLNRREMAGFQVYRDDILLNPVLIEECFFVDTEVAHNTEYHYYIRVIYQDSDSYDSNVVSVTAYVNEPQDFSYNAGNQIVLLSWIEPEEPSERFMFYRIVRNGVQIAEIEDLFYLDYDITNNTEYTYELSALYDNPFTESDPVNLTAVGLVYPPHGLEADTGDGFVSLTWEAPPVDYFNNGVLNRFLSGYNVYRDETLLTNEIITDESYYDTDVVNGITYSYFVTAVYEDPYSESDPSEAVEAEPGCISIDDFSHINSISALGDCFPNPFNPDISIEFFVSGDSHVSLAVFNLKGQLIKILVDNYPGRGKHLVSWNGTNEHGQAIASGIYLLRLTTDDIQDVKKIMLLK